MTKEEAVVKINEFTEFVKVLASEGFKDSHIPILRQILIDFKEINGLYPCQEGQVCIDLVEKIIDMFPEEKVAEV